MRSRRESEKSRQHGKRRKDEMPNTIVPKAYKYRVQWKRREKYATTQEQWFTNRKDAELWARLQKNNDRRVRILTRKPRRRRR